MENVKQHNGGYIYIVEFCGYYKIGWSRNVEHRVRNLFATLPPVEPQILLVEPIRNHNVEKLLHEKFAEQRVRGEWFNLSESDIELAREFLKDYKAPCGCVLYDNGPPDLCQEARRLRSLMPRDKPLRIHEAAKTPFVQHLMLA